MQGICVALLGITALGVGGATLAEGGSPVRANVGVQTEAVSPYQSTSANLAIDSSDKSAPAPAKTLIDQAVKTAKASNKTVLVHFGASWCGYCKRFNAFLHSEEAGKIMDAHYVVLELTAQERPEKKGLENPGVDSIAKVMELKGGLPVFFFLNGEGKKLADSGVMPPDGGNIGYPVTADEVTAFGELLKKTAPKMTQEELTKITEYLTNAAKRS